MANISVTKEITRAEAIDEYHNIKSKIDAHQREIDKLNKELLLIEPQLTIEEKTVSLNIEVI